VIITLIIGPKGPEPALGFFGKKTPDCPKKSGVPRRHVDGNKQNNIKSFRPTSPGVARTFFSFYVIIITSTLRFRLRYVTVAGVRFSFTLRYRTSSGREIKFARRESHRMGANRLPVQGGRVPFE